MLAEDRRVSFVRVLADVAPVTAPFALATLASVPGVFCLIGVPLLLRALGTLYLRAVGRRSGPTARWKIGVLALPVSTLPLIAVGVTDLCEPLADLAPALRGVFAWALAMIVGVLLAPLHFAPLLAAESEHGMLAALLASGARVSRRPTSHALLRGAALGTVTIAPWLLLSLASSRSGTQLLATVTLFAAAELAALVVSIGLLAHHYGEGGERFGAMRRASTTPTHIASEMHAGMDRRRIAGSLLLALLPALLVGVVLLIALLTPTPAWTPPPTDDVAQSEVTLLDDHVLLDESSGLQLTRTDQHRWRLETADGGGAGELRAACPRAIGSWLVREPGGWALCEACPGTRRCVRFDGAGVRRDDGPLARLQARLGLPGLVVLGLYVIAWLGLASLQLRRMGIAAHLDRPRGEGHPQLAAIEAVLRSEVPVTMSARALVLARRARLELGAYGTVRLPEGRVPLLVATAGHEPVRDGTKLTLLAALPAIAGSPFREGDRPLPRDARLALGDLTQAREAYLEDVARTNVLVSLPLFAVALGLCLTILSNL